MSKLTVDQKTIFNLFSDPEADFLIPDYQRPYAWEIAECQTLWEDIYAFSFPGNSNDAFNASDKYFLGPIVTFRNDGKKMEVIDGQQRLTTLMLLLRAFYEKFLSGPKDENSRKTRERIESCIWKTDEFGNPDKMALKISSEVATEKDKEEFMNILRTGQPSAGKKDKNNYAENYKFFQNQIKDFLEKSPSLFALLPTRILQNCILLPIEAESQDTALRIFNTLNDRGKPLSDADIFKAQMYKFYADLGEKGIFIERWKELESVCADTFHPKTGTPMDELFTRYMYYPRALAGNTNTTTEALRKFYEQSKGADDGGRADKDAYALLRVRKTFDDLVALADFWHDVAIQEPDRFSAQALRRLFVLGYAPNGMWTYIVSVYFLHNRDKDGRLDDEKFCAFLKRITAFIWAYYFTNPGVNALRTPIYAEMVNIVRNKPTGLGNTRIDLAKLENTLTGYDFIPNRSITKSMLAWWAFQDGEQGLLSLETGFDTEHIFPKSRQKKGHSLKNTKNLEALGNKSFLEKKINISASDYRFADKKKYYQGTATKAGTKINELLRLAESHKDFTEKDIEERTERIINGFLGFIKENGLAA